jgi:hypothetical protein
MVLEEESQVQTPAIIGGQFLFVRKQGQIYDMFFPFFFLSLPSSSVFRLCLCADILQGALPRTILFALFRSFFRALLTFLICHRPFSTGNRSILTRCGAGPCLCHGWQTPSTYKVPLLPTQKDNLPHTGLIRNGPCFSPFSATLISQIHSVIRALFSLVQTLRRERDEEQREREARDRAKEEERIYRWADTVQLHSGNKAFC